MSGLVAFRAWTLTDGGLSAAHIADGLWPVGLAQARCHAGATGHRLLDHDRDLSAVEGCHCGWYGNHDPGPALALAARGGGSLPDRIAGVIEVGGRVQVHATGLRAERAVVRALSIPRGLEPTVVARVRTVAQMHDAMLCSATPQGLRAAAAEFGDPCDPVLDIPIRPLWVLEAAALGRLVPHLLELRDRPGWIADAAVVFLREWGTGPDQTTSGEVLAAVLRALGAALGVPPSTRPTGGPEGVAWLTDVGCIRDHGGVGAPTGLLDRAGVPPRRELLTDAQADALARDVLRQGGAEALNVLIEALGPEMAFDLDSAAPLVDAGATHRSLVTKVLSADAPERDRRVWTLADRADQLPTQALMRLSSSIDDGHPLGDYVRCELLARPDLGSNPNETTNVLRHAGSRLDPDLWADLRDRLIAEPGRPVASTALALAARPDEVARAWAVARVAGCDDIRDLRALLEVADPAAVSTLAVDRLRAGDRTPAWWARLVLPRDPELLAAIQAAPNDPDARWAWVVLARDLTGAPIDSTALEVALGHAEFPADHLPGLIEPSRGPAWGRLGSGALGAVWANPLTGSQTLYRVLCAMPPEDAARRARCALADLACKTPDDSAWRRARAALAWLPPDEQSVATACRLLLEGNPMTAPARQVPPAAMRAALRHLPADAPLVEHIRRDEEHEEPVWPYWLRRGAPASDRPVAGVLWRLGDR